MSVCTSDGQPIMFVLNQLPPASSNPLHIVERGVENGVAIAIAEVSKNLIVGSVNYLGQRVSQWKWGNQEIKDHELLTEMFLEDCGGMLKSADKLKETRKALLRSKNEPLYASCTNRFIQCISHKPLQKD